MRLPETIASGRARQSLSYERIFRMELRNAVLHHDLLLRRRSPGYLVSLKDMYMRPKVPELLKKCKQREKVS